MRSVKPHHGWKLDDERRKRSTGSTIPASPTRTTPTFDNSPANYTHEKTHTGTDDMQMSMSKDEKPNYALIVQITRRGLIIAIKISFISKSKKTTAEKNSLERQKTQICVDVDSRVR